MEYENKLNTFLSNPKNISYTLDFTRDQKIGYTDIRCPRYNNSIKTGEKSS